jgi:predicted RND superfamily exporter protein
MHNAAGISPVMMFNNISLRNIESMVVGTGIGFLAIALILVVALRDLRLGALSLLPNMLPAAVAIGIWALLVGDVGFAVSIVAGLSIGIIVDNTVHFLVKYQYAKTVLNSDTRAAVTYAFEIVAPALIGTTLIVAVGFAMLGFSGFRVTAYMGVLTALAIVCALVIDLLLLPAMLILFDCDDQARAIPKPANASVAL